MLRVSNCALIWRSKLINRLVSEGTSLHGMAIEQRDQTNVAITGRLAPYRWYFLIRRSVG